MTRIITHFMTHSKPVFGQEWKNIYLEFFFWRSRKEKNTQQNQTNNI